MEGLNMNPYASFPGRRNAREVIAETAERLAAAAAALGSEGVEHSPAPGKWNARQILCHLADTEIVFAFRLRQSLAEPHHTIQPFDQDTWASRYAAFDAASAVEVFSSVRAWNRTLIESLPADAFAKRLSHPERGEMSFQTLVETMAGHDLNHLRQLDAIVSHAVSA